MCFSLTFSYIFFDKYQQKKNIYFFDPKEAYSKTIFAYCTGPMGHYNIGLNKSIYGYKRSFVPNAVKIIKQYWDLHPVTEGGAHFFAQQVNLVYSWIYLFHNVFIDYCNYTEIC